MLFFLAVFALKAVNMSFEDWDCRPTSSSWWVEDICGCCWGKRPSWLLTVQCLALQGAALWGHRVRLAGDAPQRHHRRQPAWEPHPRAEGVRAGWGAGPRGACDRGRGRRGAGRQDDQGEPRAEPLLARHPADTHRPTQRHARKAPPSCRASTGSPSSRYPQTHSTTCS